MKAVNATRSAVLHSDVRVARTLGEKTEGLLKSAPNDALFFETRWGIHTFRMKFRIDVAVMDDDMMIVALRENLMPGRFFFWNPRHKNVLELPAGTIQHTGTKMGDTIQIQ